MKNGAKALSAVLVAGTLLATLPVTSRAADQDEIRALQQQMQEMAKKLEALQKKQEQQEAAQKAAPQAPAQSVAGTPGPTPKAPKEAPAETRFDKFMKGFFGTLDVSVDYTTKGMDNLVAYPWDYASGAPGSPYVRTGPAKAGPYGKVSWLGAMSSNGSNVGYRGTHQIGTSNVDFIYQVSTSLNMVAAPGLQNTWTKSSNTVQGAIGLGDTYLGFQGHSWGK
ncbi:MAG TPA: hypothetical protein VH209_11915, partial [Steroidobacteraceae bacterium]|nr:hypothetical protein [Steroidobacteraceae bacterium]